MSNGIFKTHAPKYWAVGLSALPVQPGTKRPSVEKWTSYQANIPNDVRKSKWLEKYGDHGIGVNTGTEIVKDKILVGIDIDDDQLVRMASAVIGDYPCAKQGKKGLTIFALMSKSESIKSTALKGGTGVGNIDLLAGGRFAIIPPTVHPETNEPYEWIGASLDDVDPAALPNLSKRKLGVLSKAVGSNNASVLLSGQTTHNAGVALVAELVSANANDNEIHAIIRGYLPENYTGNSLDELPGWIESARDKGFDQKIRNLDYDPGSIGPVPLGFTKDGHYAVRDQTRNIIVVLSSSQLLNLQTLIGLAPSDFWSEQFPNKKGAFSSMVAGEAIIQDCRSCGPFDSATIRGRGVWKENGQIIVNLGGWLPSGLHHQYLAFSPVPIKETSEFDTAGLLNLYRRFPFKNADNADLLFGWTCLAPLCGALDWRMHTFLYGPPNSGKTSIHNLVSSILHPMVVAADGQSTEAGIRQSLGPDALPVALDEFETDSHQSRLQGIMRLARSASSAESPLLRGTPEGKAIQFNIKTMMLFSAVNVTGMTPADQSRITVIELVSHNSDPKVAEEITRGTAKFGILGPNWCGYMIGLAPQVLESIEILKAAMGAVESRLRQTMASLLAGMFVASKRRCPTQPEARALVERYQVAISAHWQDQDRDNALECLEHLMSHLVRGVEGFDYPLGHWIATELSRLKLGQISNDTSESERVLARFQIKFFLKKGQEGYLIRNGAPPINEVFKNTKWADDTWARALGQLSGAFKLPNPQSFTGLSGKHRSVGLPLNYVPDSLEDPTLREDF